MPTNGTLKAVYRGNMTTSQPDRHAPPALTCTAAPLRASGRGGTFGGIMHATPGHGSGAVDSNALLLSGMAILGGALAARLFKRLRVPQVVGYIVIGLVVGQSGFALIDASALAALESADM